MSITTPKASRPRFEWRGARRYLADTPYALPKDPQEVRRLDFQHFMLRQELHGNYLAPLNRPRSILDVGCGTGRWAMEMAAEFPHARVVGMDLVLPDSAASLGHGLERQPDNVAWIEGDLLQGLPFADSSFDFVYLRFLLFAVPEQAWSALLDELLRVTRPGGWIESVESWVNLSPAFPASATFADWVNELLRRRGCAPHIARTMPELLRARGLERIATRELAHKPPQSLRWHQIYSAVGLTALENFRTPITAQGIVTADHYDQVAARARQESERSSTLMWPAYITYGQRPTSLRPAPTPPRSSLVEKYERLFGHDDQEAGKANAQEEVPGP
jgi:ubiquinone/menaquinone biosynthesis C-methylase UbiE